MRRAVEPGSCVKKTGNRIYSNEGVVGIDEEVPEGDKQCGHEFGDIEIYPELARHSPDN